MSMAHSYQASLAGCPVARPSTGWPGRPRSVSRLRVYAARRSAKTMPLTMACTMACTMARTMAKSTRWRTLSDFSKRPLPAFPADQDDSLWSPGAKSRDRSPAETSRTNPLTVIAPKVANTQTFDPGAVQDGKQGTTTHSERRETKNPERRNHGTHETHEKKAVIRCYHTTSSERPVRLLWILIVRRTRCPSYKTGVDDHGAKTA